MATYDEISQSCQWVQERLEAYLDGDLDWAANNRLEGHLASCSVCTEDLALAREIQTGIRAFPKVTCPSGTAERLASITRASSSSPGRWPLRAALAAAAIVVVTIAGTLWRTSNPPSNSDSATMDSAEGLALDQAAIESTNQEIKAALAYLGHLTMRTTENAAAGTVEFKVVPQFTKTLDILTGAIAPAEEPDDVS